MEKRDYYEVLGVSKTATDDELKKAYRKMAIQYHPDRQQGKSEEEKKAAEEKFKEAAEAYDVLSNPDKRARYDQFGHSMGNMGGGGYGGAGMSMDDIFRNFGDIFSGFGFGSGFGGFGSSRTGRRQNRGTDLRVKVRVTLKDVAHGVEKKLKIPRYVACSHCNGSGARSASGHTTCPKCHGSGVITQVRQTFLGTMQETIACPNCGGEGRIITDKCPHCNGEGIERKEEVVTVKIPAGVANGMILRMEGSGNAARRGGVPGDLLIVIEEENDSELLREDNNLIYNLIIDFPTAVLGGKVDVPTVDGRARLTIEPGTQPGKVLRLRGKGLPSPNSYGNGDLLVNIMVYVPKKLSPDEKAAIEKLRGSNNMTPTENEKRSIFASIRHMFE